MKTAAEWANRFGIPEERVRAIQADALGSIRYRIVCDPILGPHHTLAAEITRIIPSVDGEMDESGAILDEVPGA